MDSLHNSPEKEKDVDKIMENISGNETARIPATIIEKQTHMICYYLVGKEWHNKEFTANKTKYHIGSSSQDSEIAISEPEAERIQVVVKKVGDIWFVMEYARRDLLHINGIPNHQFLFKNNGYCYLKIGNSKLLLVKGENQFKIAKGVQENNKFVLTQGETKMAFSTTEPCLIGSDASSDFIINQSMLENNLDPLLEEPFHAMINSCKNQLFIDSISEKYPVLLKDQMITEPTSICNGSAFSIGGVEFSISNSNTIENTEDLMNFSDMKKKTFMLLQILGNDEKTVVNIELPKPGKAATIGRGDDATYKIDNVRISKQHVQLIVYEKSVLATDLNSTNGIFVNDEKVKKKLMHPGDFITIGDFSFFLCYNEA